MKLLPKIFPQSDDQKRAQIERELIRKEAEIGAKVFGPLPAGHQRQFFCLDEDTWIWYESWIENGQLKSQTTRYIVRPSGVLKSQASGRYHPLSDDEARNLYRATKLYQDNVETYYRQLLQVA